MIQLYEGFRHLHTEWAVYSAILAYGLYRLFLPEGGARERWLYVIGNAITLAVILPLANVIPFNPVFETQGTAIWAFFLLFFINSGFWLWFRLRSHFKIGLVYTLYALAFIAVGKTAFGALYTAETRMSRGVYALCDMAVITFQSLALWLLTRLFRHTRVMLPPRKTSFLYSAMLLTPFIIIVALSLSISGNTALFVNVTPILASAMMAILPILYYIGAAGTAEIAHRQSLELALMETQSRLIHYRDMLELENRIRQERHELKNRYLHIQILLHENRLEELETYLSDEIGARMQAISDPLTGNVFIDYILSLKRGEAVEAGIPFHTDIVLNRRPAISDDVFCTVLLNLLDNALEASRQESRPDIRVRLANEGGYLILVIRNRISKDVLKVNPGLRTTKSDAGRHGYGLAIVRSTVDEAGGMLDIRCEDEYFEVTAALRDTGVSNNDDEV